MIQKIKNVAVIGTGVLGTQIAMLAANAGNKVRVYDTRESALDETYNRRLGTAEPPFAHICSILGLDRFTLRGKPKVNVQWLFYCIVHNLTKIHRYGEGLA
jgi:hypothetical protein